MKTQSESRQERAFTLPELLLCLAVAGLLLSVAVVGAGENRAASRAVQCLNNLQQLGAAWLMYPDDYSGRLAPNRGSGLTGTTTSWVGGWLDYTANPANTNTTYLIGPVPFCGMLGPYIRSASYFRCPSDPSWYPITGQPRVRSYSMNNFVGDGGKPLSGFTSYQLYPTIQSIGRPSPSQLWIILEEHPDSINEGTFFTTPDETTPRLVDLPAWYHGSSCNFVFADGHCAPVRWVDSRTLQPILRTIPSTISSPNNPDVRWLLDHATSRRQ